MNMLDSKINWVQQYLLPQLRYELHPTRLPSNLTVGLTTGAIGVVFDLSYAVLIFSGSLSAHLSAGIGLVLFSAASTRILVALTSSLPGMVADLSTVPTAILAWSVGMVVKSLPPTISATELWMTALATIALTSFLTGAFLLLLGGLRLGKLVQSMPHAVIGGFIASTGWLLVKGAFKLMTDHPLGLAQLPILLQAHTFMQWLPGLLLALYLLLISRRHSHPLMLSASLFGSIALFYILLSLSGTSAAQASTQGWTLNIATAPPTQGSHSFDLSLLSQVQWNAIAAQWMCLATVGVTAAISLLMNVGSLKLVTHQAIDANRELAIAGMSNLAIGLFGGILSFHSLSKSMLAHRLGSNRLATLIDAGVFLVVSALGVSLLSYFPKPVLGGLLLYLGLSLLIEWVIMAGFKLSLPDYLVVQVVLVVSATIGFLQGLTVGWIVAIAVVAISSIRTQFTQSRT
jgi:sulfate permease, SulP family